MTAVNEATRTVISDRQAKFWMFLVWFLPRRLLYFTVIHVWARATTERYTDKQPDEVTWSMALKHLGVE